MKTKKVPPSIRRALVASGPWNIAPPDETGRVHIVTRDFGRIIAIPEHGNLQRITAEFITEMTTFVTPDGTVNWGASSDDAWARQSIVRGWRPSQIKPAPGPYAGEVCLHDGVYSCRVNVLPGPLQDDIVLFLLHLAEAVESITD